MEYLERMFFMSNEFTLVQDQVTEDVKSGEHWGKRLLLVQDLSTGITFGSAMPGTVMPGTLQLHVSKSDCFSKTRKKKIVVRHWRKTLFGKLLASYNKRFCLFSLPRTFPWFDLTAAQLRESPFSQLLDKSEFLQKHLALLYQASFGDWPTKQRGLISTKTSLTSAVVEPGVVLAHKTSLPTTTSNIFSEIPEETADYDSKSS